MTKGRKDGRLQPFAPLDRRLLDSEAFLSLSPTARALLIEVVRWLNPARSNNGVIMLLDKQMLERGFSKDTFRRALRALTDREIVVVTKRGGRNRASYYGVTCFPIGDDAHKCQLDIDPKKWPMNRYLLWQATTAREVANPERMTKERPPVRTLLTLPPGVRHS